MTRVFPGVDAQLFARAGLLGNLFTLSHSELPVSTFCNSLESVNLSCLSQGEGLTTLRLALMNVAQLRDRAVTDN